MRLAFLGTPEASVPSLDALIDGRHDVRVVVTRPDRRRGRGSALVASPVKIAAQRHGVPVVHSLKELENFEVERGIVVAYGALIPSTLLERVPMLNVHFSLLPRWRGAAPVERAILAGDDETGVCVMTLEPELDTGPVHAKISTPIGEKTSQELTQELARLGATLLIQVLENQDLLHNATAQDGVATYAAKLTKEDFHILSSMSATMISRLVRLGRAYCFVAERRLRIVRGRAVDVAGVPGTLSFNERVLLHTSDGSYELDEVQAEGSRAMTALEWWSGARLSTLDTVWT